MKKNLILFLTFGISITLISLQTATAQSWNITGNNNTTALSKLGTTNFIPLNLVTNDQTRVRIDEIGRVGIGTTSPVNILTVQSGGSTPVSSWLNNLNSPIFAGFAEGVSSEFVLAAANTLSTRRAVIQGRRSRGTLASPAAVQNNDYIASYLASAHDGTTFQNPATIDFFVDGAVSSGNVPARISFVTGTNADNRQERLKVGSTGNFNFNDNQLFVSASLARVGIGTTAPERKLHIFNGSAGTVTANANAPLVVEDNINTYINVLAPSANERGILFGDELNAQDGGIIYNGASNSLQFRTNGNATRMSLSSTGNLSVSGNIDIAGTTVSFGSVETLADAGSDLISCNSSFVPNTDNSSIKSLGSSTLRWHDVWAADGTINTSDARDKTNIRDLDYGIKEIMKLRSARYNWKIGEETGDKLGLIAQELQKVLPEVVRDSEFKRNEETGVIEKVPTARLGVAYSDIIPVLIRGIQEQQVTIEAKDKEITELKSELNNLKYLLISKGIITKSELNNPSPASIKASLSQSKPNPTNGNTTVGYYLPNDVKKAAIIVSSVNGAIVKSYPLSQRGNGQLTINSKELASGVYVYSLVVNGNKFDSKKLVVTK